MGLPKSLFLIPVARHSERAGAASEPWVVTSDLSFICKFQAVFQLTSVVGLRALEHSPALADRRATKGPKDASGVPFYPVSGPHMV
jgi:hypothetical protein